MPWLLARGMAFLPTAPLELVVDAIFNSVLARHPRMLARLGQHARKRFAIDPIDCPFAFLLEPNPASPRLRVVSSLEGERWDARIAGPMLVLLGLLDGTYDGDAVFFSRDLVIEGDTSAVLALRNTIEDAELDPGSILGLPSRIAPLVSAGVREAAAGLRYLLGAPAAAPAQREGL